MPLREFGMSLAHVKVFDTELERQTRLLLAPSIESLAEAGGDWSLVPGAGDCLYFSFPKTYFYLF